MPGPVKNVFADLASQFIDMDEELAKGLGAPKKKAETPFLDYQMQKEREQPPEFSSDNRTTDIINRSKQAHIDLLDPENQPFPLGEEGIRQQNDQIARYDSILGVLEDAKRGTRNKTRTDQAIKYLQENIDSDTKAIQTMGPSYPAYNYIVPHLKELEYLKQVLQQNQPPPEQPPELPTVPYPDIPPEKISEAIKIIQRSKASHSGLWGGLERIVSPQISKEMQQDWVNNYYGKIENVLSRLRSGEEVPPEDISEVLGFVQGSQQAHKRPEISNAGSIPSAMPWFNEAAVSEYQKVLDVLDPIMAYYMEPALAEQGRLMGISGPLEELPGGAAGHGGPRELSGGARGHAQQLPPAEPPEPPQVSERVTVPEGIPSVLTRPIETLSPYYLHPDSPEFLQAQQAWETALLRAEPGQEPLGRDVSLGDRLSGLAQFLLQGYVNAPVLEAGIPQILAAVKGMGKGKVPKVPPVAIPPQGEALLKSSQQPLAPPPSALSSESKGLVPLKGEITTPVGMTEPWRKKALKSYQRLQTEGKTIDESILADYPELRITQPAPAAPVSAEIPPKAITPTPATEGVVPPVGVGVNGVNVLPETLPKATDVSGNLKVSSGNVPNTESISASLTDYEELPGIRELPMNLFNEKPPKFYSVEEEIRTKRLADAIKQSGEIKPLIVVYDKEGYYILEGGHRYDALKLNGAKSFPAVVVKDLESLSQSSVPPVAVAPPDLIEQQVAALRAQLKSKTPTGLPAGALPIKPPGGGIPPVKISVDLPPEPPSGTPIKPVSPPNPVVSPEVPPVVLGRYWLPEPPRVIPKYIESARKAVGGIGTSWKNAQGAFDTVEQANQLVLKSRDLGTNTIPRVMSYLRNAGNLTKEFGLDAQGLATKVGNPEGRSLAINDILSNYTHYKLTSPQVAIAKAHGFIYREALKLAKSYGVKIAELPAPDEYWQYIARRVKNKIDPVTGKLIEPPPTIGGFKMGAKISAQKERSFEQMMEGVDAGYLYEHPDEVIQSHIKGIYRLIGNKQASDLIVPFTRQVTEKAPMVFGESAIFQPSLRGRVAATELVNKIESIFQPEKANRVLEIGAKVSEVAVGQVAALDVSAPFLQGLPALGQDIRNGLAGHPSAIWAKSYGKMWQGFFKPETITKYRMANQDLYKEAIEAGILTGDSEFVTGVSMAQKGLGKIPVAGKTLKEAYRQSWGRAGEAYSDFLEVAKVEFFKTMKDTWLRQGGNIYDLGALSNRMLGAVSSSARGVSANRRNLERIAAFAPNYMRSSLLLLKDLGERGVTANEVRKTIGAMLGVGFAVYVAEEKLRGQEPKIKPWAKKWGGDGADAFTTVIGNTRVGLGSWMYGMIKLVADTTAMAVDDPSAIVVFDNQHPLNRYLKTKRGAALGLVSDLATGSNFFGQKYDSADDYLLRVVESFVPISAQSLITQEPKGDVYQVGAELQGLRAYPYTQFSKWTDAGRFKLYNDTPSNPIELKAAQRKDRRIISRIELRQRDPDLDAKLFITKQVSSLTTPRAVNSAFNLMQANKIDPTKVDGIANRQKQLEKAKTLNVRLTPNNVDLLIRRLPTMTSPQNTSVPSQTPSTPVPAAPAVIPTPGIDLSSPSKENAIAKWETVRSVGGQPNLTVLYRVWYQNGTLTSQEEQALRQLFAQLPFGATDFNQWYKQTLYNVYLNSVAAEAAGAKK